jgi:hypothetical protein
MCNVLSIDRPMARTIAIMISPGSCGMNADFRLSWRCMEVMGVRDVRACVRSVGPVDPVGPVGPVGFGERGFDLFCWLSRVLVSPAGSIGSVETLKKISIHPSRTWRRSSPYPPHVRRFGGHCSTPLYSPKGRAPPYLSTVRHKRRDIR